MKIIIISLLLLSKAYGQDSTKKYVLTLTQNEFNALQEKLNEAAIYEAQIQKDKIANSYMEFLKNNTSIIKPEADSVKVKR